MLNELIVKSSSTKKNSNLSDYKKVYSSFSQNPTKEQTRDIAYVDGKLNAAYNAIERHANSEYKNKVALYWVGGEEETLKFTFREINDKANQFANLLHELKIEQGDRVFFFLTRVPSLYYSFLGTLKRGAVAGTLFAAFGEQALLDRLGNSSAKVVVTEPALLDRLLKVAPQLPDLKTIIVTDTNNPTRERTSAGKKIISLEKHIDQHSTNYKTRQLDPDTPAFMLYTSGTTGKPKGVVHAHRAIIHEHITAKYVLDLQPDDVYWCTADPGWVTGVAYTILGSWSNGAATLVYNGRFKPEIWYKLIQDYKVTIWYTAPTAVRMLQAGGIENVKKYDLSSLRHMCSVGEPLNPEPIRWGMKAFGLPFHDNFFQTETGGIVIANYPSMDIKVGSMGKPVPGVIAAVVDEKGKPVPTNQEGNLALKPGWPSMMMKIWRRPQKYQSYFDNGWYLTGDKAMIDKDGYFWFIGRSDDVIKTSGERVGPFEVESALIDHPSVIEAGVIGKPDALRGHIIKAFVKLSPGHKPSEELKEKLQKFVKKHLAGHAYPREIEFVTKLPKTRSGKIMRRLLKARELNLPLGDTSTLQEY